MFKLWMIKPQGWAYGHWLTRSEAIRVAKSYGRAISVQEYDEQSKRYVHRASVLANGEVLED